MKISALAIVALLVCTAAQAQKGSTAPVDIVDEPHHTVLLENLQVRAFRLELQPGEATLPHRHKNLYAYLSLRPMTIANEVRGRPPVVVSVEGGEVHISKGGFTLAERNKSSEPADLLVIEALKSDGAGFATPIGGFRFHDAAFGTLFEFSVMRGYTMTIAAGGRTEKHDENYDRVLIAVSDLKLQEDSAGQPSSELQMKAGDVKWFARGISHATTNTGTSPATFITLEFE
jgi:quercetin dioxygenase-like cupin family protein